MWKSAQNSRNRLRVSLGRIAVALAVLCASASAAAIGQIVAYNPTDEPGEAVTSRLDHSEPTYDFQGEGPISRLLGPDAPRGVPEEGLGGAPSYASSLQARSSIPPPAST